MNLVLILLAFLGAIVGIPLLCIAAINVLLHEAGAGASIPYTFWTWAAALWLVIVVQMRAGKSD